MSLSTAILNYIGDLRRNKTPRPLIFESVRSLASADQLEQLVGKTNEIIRTMQRRDDIEPPTGQGDDGAAMAMPPPAVALPPRIYENPTYISQTDGFLAKITGHAALAGYYYRWKYAFSEVTYDGDTIAAVAGGRSGTTTVGYALNLREYGHTASFAWGVKVDAAGYPPAFAPKAVGGGGATDAHCTDEIVWMEHATDVNGVGCLRFSAPGSHDGTCGWSY